MTKLEENATPPHQDHPGTARVAVALLFSVLASVWLIGDGEVKAALLRWLVLVSAIGLLLNSQVGESLKFLVAASSACALTMVLSTAFQAYAVCRQQEVLAPPLLSGVNLCREPSAFLLVFLLFFFAVTSLGICIGALARPILVDALVRLPSFATKAKQTEKALRVVVVSTAAILVLVSVAAKF